MISASNPFDYEHRPYEPAITGKHIAVAPVVWPASAKRVFSAEPWPVDYVPPVTARVLAPVAISLRTPQSCVVRTEPIPPYFVPFVTGRPSIAAPTLPTLGRVFQAESQPWDYVPPVRGRGTGEPKVHQFGRVFVADEYKVDPVSPIIGRGYALPVVRSATGQIVRAELPWRDYVPPVASLGSRPLTEHPARSNGRYVQAEPFPRDYIPPVMGSPATTAIQTFPRSQGAVVPAPDAPHFRDAISTLSGRGTITTASRTNGLVVRVVDYPLYAAAITGRNWGIVAATPSTPDTVAAPYRLAAGQIHYAGAVAGQTGGQG